MPYRAIFSVSCGHPYMPTPFDLWCDTSRPRDVHLRDQRVKESNLPIQQVIEQLAEEYPRGAVHARERDLSSPWIDHAGWKSQILPDVCALCTPSPEEFALGYRALMRQAPTDALPVDEKSGTQSLTKYNAPIEARWAR